MNSNYNISNLNKNLIGEIEEDLVAYLYFLLAATKSQYIIGKWCYDHDRVGDALLLSMYYLKFEYYLSL